VDHSIAALSPLAVASALWLGILTSISPCPLATNIAAVSFIGRRVGSPRRVLFTGVLYALGRTLAYLALGALLVTSVLSVPELSMFLQRYMNKLLGPILIVAAMFLLDMISLKLPGSGISQSMQTRLQAIGAWGALPLGMIFALTFCPVSAALYFGSLIPLAIKVRSSVVLPGAYGIGTALPALAFALLLALSARSVGQAYGALAKVERGARWTTGVVFLGIGVYYSLKFIFGIV
jgi:cytochrome c-type biogenesis protein